MALLADEHLLEAWIDALRRSTVCRGFVALVESPPVKLVSSHGLAKFAHVGERVLRKGVLLAIGMTPVELIRALKLVRTKDHGSPPGVFPAGSREDHPGLLIDSVSLAQQLNQWADSLPSGTLGAGSYAGIVYCLEGETFEYDLDDCRLIQHWEWYSVWNEKLKQVAGRDRNGKNATGAVFVGAAPITGSGRIPGGGGTSICKEATNATPR